MRFSFLIISFLLSWSAFGQDAKQQSYWKTIIDKDVKALGMAKLDSTDNFRTYRIWKNSFQIVELSQVNNSTFEGQIVNYVTKVSGSRKKPKSELLIHKTKIPSLIVKSLIDSLSVLNIETLPDSDEIENYPQGFDGTTYVFEVGKEGFYRFYSYWEPENERYQNGDLVEIISVRKIIKTLKSELSLGKSFSGFIDSLPKGSYSYGGINIVKP